MIELGWSAEEILKGREYLEAAAIPPDQYPVLYVDQQAMQAALASASLMEPEGRNWNVLLQDMSRFRTGIFTVYRAHHERVHGELPAYARNLDSARSKMAALGLMNSLTELGEPIGAGLAQSLADWDAAPMRR